MALLPVGVKLVHGRVILNLLFSSESSNSYRGRAGYPLPMALLCAPRSPRPVARKLLLHRQQEAAGAAAAARGHIQKPCSGRTWPQRRRRCKPCSFAPSAKGRCNRGTSILQEGIWSGAVDPGRFPAPGPLCRGWGGGDGGGRAREGELPKARKLTKLEQRLRAKVVPRIFKSSHTLQACPQLPGRRVR